MSTDTQSWSLYFTEVDEQLPETFAIAFWPSIPHPILFWEVLLTELSGGKVSLYSTEGEGSQMHLLPWPLPLAPLMATVGPAY